MHHHHRHVKLENFSRNASHDAAREKLIGFRGSFGSSFDRFCLYLIHLERKLTPNDKDRRWERRNRNFFERVADDTNRHQSFDDFCVHRQKTEIWVLDRDSEYFVSVFWYSIPNGSTQIAARFAESSTNWTQNSQLNLWISRSRPPLANTNDAARELLPNNSSKPLEMNQQTEAAAENETHSYVDDEFEFP